MSEHGRKPNQLWGFALALLSGILLSVPGAMAQQPPAAANPAPAATQAVPPLSAPTQAQQPQEAEAQTLHLLVGRSLVITSPARIKRVSIADSNIAEAVAVSPHQVLINGKAPGGVSLLLWDESDQSQTFEVSVDMDVLGLSQQIHQAFPSEPVQVETAKDVVMLSGRVSSPAVAERIVDVAKSTTPKVASLMQVPVAPAGEIILQVRFAEVNRQAISQFGVNILHNFKSKMPFSTTTQQFTPPQLGNPPIGLLPNQTFEVSDLLNVMVFRPDLDLGAMIKALQEQNLIEILAEPNLMTESGKEASFLAGGEFPYPIVQSTGGTFGGITIQFKEFGVRLNFTPTLAPDGLIHLKVKPEVSSLDFTNALTIQGFLIPALAVNRAESEMDLSDGQSFAIAGLLDNRVQEQLEKIPGIGDIPILGKLFRSRSLTKSKNELLIVVTPLIVHPLSPEQVPHGPVFPKTFLGPAKVEQPKSPAPK